jgi:hypothetical protein
MLIDYSLTPASLLSDIRDFFEVSGKKIDMLEKRIDRNAGAPVLTANGRYTSRSWTDWTLGFEFGSMLLQYDACGEERYYTDAVTCIQTYMPDHLTHAGVHDHGFNTISTYGNILRLAWEGKHPLNPDALGAASLAVRVSGAVQARRWTKLSENRGFIYSFNGPHSLFADTIRSVRVLTAAHVLEQRFCGENDRTESLLHRALMHMEMTARYAVYYGDGRDMYDVPGRCAHESVFNVNDGTYRCPNSQQGYSPFTTWTRGLAWLICGFAEELECLSQMEAAAFGPLFDKKSAIDMCERALAVCCDFYTKNCAADGIPYWDTGAPGLAGMGNWRETESDPYNEYEPIDSSAASIAAQGMLRYGHYLRSEGRDNNAASWTTAALTIAKTLCGPKYLARSESHEGLVLHSVYHRPNGWDTIPEGQKIPCGESSMWGDYHARELMLLIKRMAGNDTWPVFFPPGHTMK